MKLALQTSFVAHSSQNAAGNAASEVVVYNICDGQWCSLHPLDDCVKSAAFPYIATTIKIPLILYAVFRAGVYQSHPEPDLQPFSL